MRKKESMFLRLKYLNLLFFICLIACTEPVAPEFEFESGLIFVDAFVSNEPGSSFVNIAESNFVFDIFKNQFIGNARVILRNVDTGSEVVFVEEDNRYVPPNDFAIKIHESWELDIVLEDGRNYRSLPETVTGSVPISQTESFYDPELMFDVSEDDFIPGHLMSVTFDDPSRENNFYFWRFRSFERLVICEKCTGGVFRGGCIDFDSYIDEFGPCLNKDVAEPFYTYTCTTDCWKIRYNENVNIFSDEFVDGTTVNRLPVAEIPLFAKKDILVEIQQYSISAEGYRYFKILKDIVDNNGNFNATPPAALLGNMYNPNDNQEFVLGRFTTALASTSSIFIERTDILEEPLEQTRITPETDELFFGNSLKTVFTASCSEGRFRTSIRPKNWIDR